MIWNTVRRWFNGLISGFWSFLKLVISGAEELVLAQLKDFALVTVTELAGTDFNNDEKRNAAFHKIKNYANEKAIYVKDNLIFISIGLALAAFKKGIK